VHYNTSIVAGDNSVLSLRAGGIVDANESEEDQILLVVVTLSLLDLLAVLLKSRAVCKTKNALFLRNKSAH
jgi:hypothetical protein